MPEFYPPGFAYEVEPSGAIKKATIEAGQLAAGSVTTAAIAASAVTNEKLAGAITAAKLVANQAVPAFGANGTITQQSQQNNTKKVVAAIVGDGLKTAYEYVAAEQTAFLIGVYKVAAKEFMAPTTFKVEESGGKVKITFGVAPAAAEQLLVMVLW